MNTRLVLDPTPCVPYPELPARTVPSFLVPVRPSHEVAKSPSIGPRLQVLIIRPQSVEVRQERRLFLCVGCSPSIDPHMINFVIVLPRSRFRYPRSGYVEENVAMGGILR